MNMFEVSYSDKTFTPHRYSRKFSTLEQLDEKTSTDYRTVKCSGEKIASRL